MVKRLFLLAVAAALLAAGKAPAPLVLLLPPVGRLTAGAAVG